MIEQGIAVTADIEMPYAGIKGKGQTKKTLVIIPGLSVKKVTPIASAVAGAYKEFLENGYDIYLFDRRENVSGDYSIMDMAEDTAAVMKSLGIGKTDIFGASQGGMIAACIAVTHPELVNHLMLGSTSGRHREHSDGIFKRWIALAEAGDEKGLNEDIGRSVYSKASWDKYGEGMMAANADITGAEYLHFIIMARALLSADFSQSLSEIKCRTLVIGSEGDRIFPSPCSEELMEGIGCEGYFYGNEYGHGVYDEAPDYVKRLYDFCCV